PPAGGGSTNPSYVRWKALPAHDRGPTLECSVRPGTAHDARRERAHSTSHVEWSYGFTAATVKHHSISIACGRGSGESHERYGTRSEADTRRRRRASRARRDLARAATGRVQG